MILHHIAIDRPPAEQSTVNLRMQRLDPAVHHFRESRIGRDLANRKARFGNCPESSPGGQHLYPISIKRRGNR